MFKLAVKGRIIAAGIKILGLKELNGRPTTSRYPADYSKQDKKAKHVYLRKVATSIVDEYVVDGKRIINILNSVLEHTEQDKAAANQRMTPDGRFLCRLYGCDKSYK
jgi:nucleoside diphosphate kinase